MLNLFFHINKNIELKKNIKKVILKLFAYRKTFIAPIHFQELMGNHS